MGHRTTTICDSASCTSEHDNPVARGSGAVPQGFHPGWATMHATDEKTKMSAAYDLCPACVEKIMALLRLKTPAELFRARDAEYRSELRSTLASYNVPPDEPAMPPKTCGTCNEPYVGDSCYFCPPAAPKEPAP